jgi:hypothetical protein
MQPPRSGSLDVVVLVAWLTRWTRSCISVHITAIENNTIYIYIHTYIHTYITASKITHKPHIVSGWASVLPKKILGARVSLALKRATEWETRPRYAVCLSRHVWMINVIKIPAPVLFHRPNFFTNFQGSEIFALPRCYTTYVGLLRTVGDSMSVQLANLRYLHFSR